MDLKEKIKNFTPDKLDVLLKKSKKTETSALDNIQERENTFFPLSMSQQRIWFQSQLDTTQTVYNNEVAFIIKLEHALDIERLENVINNIIEKNEILRTTFHFQEGALCQCIQPSLQLSVAFQDLLHVPQTDRMDVAIACVTKDVKKLFDIESGPLIRFSVFRVGPTEYILLKVTHHLISDGWSNNLFFAEVSRGLFDVDAATVMPPQQPQYLEFVFWEEQRLKKPYLDKRLKFWEHYLGGELPCTQLPQKGLIDKQNVQAGSQKVFKIDKELGDKIRAFSKANQTTLFVTFLSAFNTLLFRYNGEDDLVIGLPYANRQKLEFQKTLGLFMNVVPFRTRVEKEASFLSILQNINQMTKEVFSHADIPFNTLVENLNPERGGGKNPFFEILFAYQNFPHAYGGSAVETQILPIDVGHADYDFSFIVEESSDEMLIRMKYKNTLFDPYFLESVFRHFETILNKVIADPSQPICHIDYVPQDEIEDVLPQGAQGAEVNLPEERLFCSLFEKQVDKTPDQIAVEYQGETLTYTALNQKVNQLAHYLKALNLEGNVGICLEHSSSFLIAILGVLKAGLAFVPINKSLPESSLYAICEEASLAFTITQERFAAKIQKKTPVLCLDRDLEKIAKYEKHNPHLDKGANRLACIYFIPGTEGAFKGVCIEQGQLASRMSSIAREIQEASPQSFGLTAALFHGFEYTHLFYPLTQGKTIVVIPEDILDVPIDLADYLEKRAVDCLHYTPFHLEYLLQTHNTHSFLPQKLLILSGGRIPESLFQHIRSLRESCRVVTSYGPLEAPMGVMPLPSVYEEDTFLGKPNPEAPIYLVDEEMHLVPKGIKGEIVIGGAGVARGYWNQPQKNTEVFIPHPFLPLKGGQLYKTGVMGRYSKTGDLEWRGPKDGSTQIQGYSIKLESVEWALYQIEEVVQSVAVFEEPSSSKRVSCFVQLDVECTLSKEGLKQKLQSLLPLYMVPSQIVFVDHIPLNTHGQVERNQLLQNRSTDIEQDTQTPRDSIEMTLVRIWEEILQVQTVGIHEGFFDLGGHSLLALKLIQKIDHCFGVRLSLAALLENQTIEKIAKEIRIHSLSTYETPLVMIQKGDKHTGLFFAHPAGGQVLCYTGLAKSMPKNVSFYGLQAPFLDADRLSRHGSIEEIAKDYLRYVDSNSFGDVVLGGWSLGGLISFEMARIFSQEKGKFPLVVIIDQPTPGFLQEGPHASFDNAEYLMEFIQQASRFNGIEIEITYEQLIGKSFPKQSEIVYHAFMQNKIIPKDVNTQDFQKYLEVQKIQNRASKQYTPQRYEGPVLLIRAMTSQWEDTQGKYLGWESVTTDLTFKEVPGNHFSMMTLPQVQQIAELIQERIEQK